MADKALEKTRKQYGSRKGSISVKSEDRLRLPSRILPLNYLLGGGIPYGTILETFGWESTGKSLLAAGFGEVTQALGGKVLWDDAEFAFGDSAEYYTNTGLDPNEVELLEDDTIENFSDWAMDMSLYYRSRLTNNEPILLVCDSVAALECEEAQGGKQSGSKKEMGNRAKSIYKFYRVRRKLLKELGVCTIMINQVRDKVGANMFQDSTTTPGGAATAFYASIRLALMKGRAIKDKKGRKVGNGVHCFIKKNKVAPPQDKVLANVIFNTSFNGSVGFDSYDGLGAILEREGHVKKVKGIYTIQKGKYSLGKSKANLDSHWKEDAGARKAAIKLLNINTVSKTRAKIETLTSNQFPVPKPKKKKDE